MALKGLFNKSTNLDANIEGLNPKNEKPAKPHEDDSNWLVSYADMMTLLCGFFIMLFSMAKLDTPKYDSFKEAIAKQFGGEYVPPNKELAKFMTQIVHTLGLETTTVINSDVYGLMVSFQSTIFFDTLSSEVTPQGKTVLKKIIDAIANRQKETQTQYKIVVEGHTDGRPIVGGIYPSNWELSGARAARVVRMFLDQGFSPKYLTAIGYADTHPHVEARGPDGHWDDLALGKNRRVVLRVLEPKTEMIPVPEAP